VRTRLLEKEGQFDLALELAHEAAKHADVSGGYLARGRADALVAELAVHFDTALAQRLAFDTARAARDSGLRDLHWRLKRALGFCANLAGDRSAALRHYQQSAIVLQDIISELDDGLAETFVARPDVRRALDEMAALSGPGT